MYKSTELTNDLSLLILDLMLPFQSGDMVLQKLKLLCDRLGWMVTAQINENNIFLLK